MVHFTNFLIIKVLETALSSKTHLGIGIRTSVRRNLRVLSNMFGSCSKTLPLNVGSESNPKTEDSRMSHRHRWVSCAQTDSIRAKLFTQDHKQMSTILVPLIYIHATIKLSFYLDNKVSNIETSDNSNFIIANAILKRPAIELFLFLPKKYTIVSTVVIPRPTRAGTAS